MGVTSFVRSLVPYHLSNLILEVEIKLVLELMELSCYSSVDFLTLKVWIPNLWQSINTIKTKV